MPWSCDIFVTVQINDAYLNAPLTNIYWCPYWFCPPNLCKESCFLAWGSTFCPFFCKIYEMRRMHFKKSVAHNSLKNNYYNLLSFQKYLKVLYHCSWFCMFFSSPLLSHNTDRVRERTSGGGHGQCCSGEPATYERWSTGGNAAQHGLSHHRPAWRWPRWLRWRRQLRGTSAVSAKLNKLWAIL